MQTDSFVIAVGSTSGGGKTTLVKRTAELLSASTLFFDDYAKGPDYPRDIPAWLENGGDPCSERVGKVVDRALNVGVMHE